jgi:hypothetical protein
MTMKSYDIRELIDFRAQPNGSLMPVAKRQPIGETFAVELDRDESGKYDPAGGMTEADARALVERRRRLGYADEGVVVRLFVFEDGSTERAPR